MVEVTVTLHWLPDAPSFTTEQLAQVEDIWAKRPATVFNGSLFTLLQMSTQGNEIHLVGSYTEYRFYFVQRRGGVDLGVRPVGVSGLIVVDEQIVFARRSPHVTAYPNYFELVPAGGLDEVSMREDGTVDFAAQIRSEFEEEVGLSAALVREVKPFGVVYSPDDYVYDIACALTVDVEPQTIIDSLQRSTEYTAPVLVPQTQLKDWISDHETDVLPTSRKLLSLWT
ncbi:MAG: hypothetical protein F9K27_05635 [Anaerolineae bacterium]|nr:MAG: hypothetical protein F9K27_05635 [Anaerolineae bacterium]